MKTLRGEFGAYPAIMKMAELVGVDLDTPVRVYTDVCLSGGEQVTTDATGLVNYQWEEADELHLNGKVLWRTTSARFFQMAFVLVGGKEVHYAISNDCVHLDPYNDVVKSKCERCPDHGTEIASDVAGTKWSMV